MLTRLEVKGFKNLRDLKVDFGPYTCVFGANAVGKSNLFDAIAFLSHLTRGTFNEAAAQLRNGNGDIREIFYNAGLVGQDAEASTPLKLAAEMLVPSLVKDEFGKDVQVEHTYLRYELELRLDYVKVNGAHRAPKATLVSECLKPLNKKVCPSRIPWAKKAFIDSMVISTGKTEAFLKTKNDKASPYVSPVSSNRGKNLEIPTSELTSTVLSTMGRREEYPQLIAARAEMNSWMQLELEPSAMRSPNPHTALPHLSAQGGNLAATLNGLIQDAAAVADTEEESVDIRAELADIVKDLVDVEKIDVDYDEGRQLFTLLAQLRNSPLLPARLLSDGTLRFIALGLLFLDARHQRLVCFEEPENGITPPKLPEMYNLLHDMTVDSQAEVDDMNPLRQVIVNTHSPAYLYLHKQQMDEVLVAKRHESTGSFQLIEIGGGDNWRQKTHAGREAIMMTDRTVIEELLEETFQDIDFSKFFEASAAGKGE